MEIVASSEYRVDWGFFIEELSHEEGAVDFTRVNNGVAPFLANHDSRLEMGKIDSGKLENGRLIINVDFTATEVNGNDELKRIKKNMDDGVRNGISIGYRPKWESAEIVEEGETWFDDVVRFNEWELYETSSVTTPADPTVGLSFDRSTGVPLHRVNTESMSEIKENLRKLRERYNAKKRERTEASPLEKEDKMPDGTEDVVVLDPEEEGTEAETPETQEPATQEPEGRGRAPMTRDNTPPAERSASQLDYYEIAELFQDDLSDVASRAATAIRENKSLRAFARELQEARKIKNTNVISHDLTDAREFDTAQWVARGMGKQPTKDLGFEREYIEQHERDFPSPPDATGIRIPFDAIRTKRPHQDASGQRVLAPVHGGTEADNLEVEITRYDNFIEALVNRVSILPYVDMMTGLVEEQRIPAFTAAPEPDFIADGAQRPLRNVTTGIVKMSPRRVAILSDYTPIFQRLTQNNYAARFNEAITRQFAATIQRRLWQASAGGATAQLRASAAELNLFGLIHVGDTNQRTAYADRYLGEPQSTSTARAALSAVTYDDLVEMMTLGMTDDVEHDDSTHFIISPMVLGKAMTTAVMSNDIALPWYQNGRMVGYPTIVTTAANAAATEPEQQILFATLSEMIFGVWSDAVFVETDSDIQTGKKQIAFEMWCDNAYKHLEAVSLLQGS